MKAIVFALLSLLYVGFVHLTYPTVSTTPPGRSTFNATVGQHFSQSFSATGTGFPPYDLTADTGLTNGGKVPGLKIDYGTQTISGTPGTAGQYTVSLFYQDEDDMDNAWITYASASRIRGLHSSSILGMPISSTRPHSLRRALKGSPNDCRFAAQVDDGAVTSR